MLCGLLPPVNKASQVISPPFRQTVGGKLLPSKQGLPLIHASMSAQSAQAQSEANGARKVAPYGIAVVHIATSQLQDGLEPLQYWQASEF